MSELFLSSSRFLIAWVAPWVASVLLGLMAILLASYWRTVWSEVLHISRPIRVLLLVCIIGGALIRFAWVPNGHRIFFDEDRYLSYAVNFARHGQAVSMLIVSPEKIIQGDPDPAARITVPVLNAWTLKLFGYSEENLFTMAKIWSVAQIIVVFVTIRMLFSDDRAALFGAAVYAFIPISVYWSVSTNIDVYFVTFALLSLSSAVLYAREVSVRTTLLLWATTTLLLMVRFESFLVLPSLLLAIWNIRTDIHQPYTWKTDRVLLALLLPIIVIRAAISVPVFTTIWCCADATPLEIFTTSYVFRNTIPNISTFVVQPEFPAVLSILATVAILGPQPKRTVRIHGRPSLISWLICFFFIYSFYYAGQFYSYTFSGSYGRFFLMEMVPVTFFASLTFSALTHRFERGKFTEKNWILFAFVLCVLSLAPTIISYRRLISVSPWDRVVEAGPRNLHAYIDTVMIPKTPPGSTLIFGVLAPIHLVGKSVVYTDTFMNDPAAMDFVESNLKQGKPVFMFNTHTCDLFPEKCTELFKRFSFEPYTPTDDPRYPGMQMIQVLRKKS